MNEYIRSDLVRYLGNYSFKGFLSLYYGSPVFRFQCAFRLCNSKGFSKLLGNVLWKMSRTKNVIQIPKYTKIGYGLYIGHFAPIIVNETAIIGDNCNLSQFVTIGANNGKAAVIGNNVYIGPNSCLIENVMIGNNATIGGGQYCYKRHSRKRDRLWQLCEGY